MSEIKNRLFKSAGLWNIGVRYTMIVDTWRPLTKTVLSFVGLRISIVRGSLKNCFVVNPP